MPRSSPFSSEVRKEILRKERSGFRQKAPARKGRTLTPSNRLKLSPAGHVRHSRARAPAPHVVGIYEGQSGKSDWPFPFAAWRGRETRKANRSSVPQLFHRFLQRGRDKNRSPIGHSAPANAVRLL